MELDARIEDLRTRAHALLGEYLNSLGANGRSELERAVPTEHPLSAQLDVEVDAYSTTDLVHDEEAPAELQKNPELVAAHLVGMVLAAFEVTDDMSAEEEAALRDNHKYGFREWLWIVYRMEFYGGGSQ